jgi:PAS domain S-box-containing protein
VSRGLSLPALDAPLAPDAYVDVLARTGMGMVCILGTDGRIVLFDEACERATGFAAEEVVGRDARETVIPPEEAEAFGVFIEQLAGAPSPSPQVGHWLTRAGERLVIAWSNRPIVDQRGSVSGLLTVGIDLTERERASAELRALHAELRRRLEEQAALRRVATLVAGEAAADLVFDAVAGEVARVAGADASAVVRYAPDATATVVGRFGGDPAVFPVGSAIPITPGSALGRVFATGEPARADDTDSGSAIAQEMRRQGYTASAATPIGASWGAIVVAARGELVEDVDRRLAAFADLLVLAIASTDAREQLLDSRARLVTAADEERRRIERDLHDGAQQRLVTLALKLSLAQKRAGDDGRLLALLGEAEADAREALGELRQIARGLHPPVLAELGLGPALNALARRAPLPVSVDHTPEERFPPTLEGAVYYVAAEALTNVAKHAEATRASLSVRRDGARLVMTVADDGRGGANPGAGTGLRGLTDRVEALRGTLDLTSTPAAGTTLRAEFPL